MSAPEVRTEAGRALLRLGLTNPLYHHTLLAGVAAIEAEAIATERARIVAAVDGVSDGSEANSRQGTRLVGLMSRAAVLAIVNGEAL